jgi:hypothetical protein
MWFAFYLFNLVYRPKWFAFVRLCIECADLFLLYASMVFPKDIFSAIYMESIKGFVPIRYRGYCLCISPHLILIYWQARVFQQNPYQYCGCIDKNSGINYVEGVDEVDWDRSKRFGK